MLPNRYLNAGCRHEATGSDTNSFIPVTLRNGPSRTKWWIALAGTGALTTALLAGPASGDLQDKKRENAEALSDAHEDVLVHNKKVQAASRDLSEAQDKLPAARQRLEEARAEQERLEALTRAAEQELSDAQEEVASAERQLKALEDSLVELRADVGDFARRAYQVGPFSEIEMLLDSRSPSDFTERLATIRSLTWTANDAVTDVAERRANATHVEAELEELRRRAVEKKKIAEERYGSAQEAAQRALEAKQEVDRLVAAQERALKVAKEHQAEIKEIRRARRRAGADQAADRRGRSPRRRA